MLFENSKEKEEECLSEKETETKEKREEQEPKETKIKEPFKEEEKKEPEKEEPFKEEQKEVVKEEPFKEEQAEPVLPFSGEQQAHKKKLTKKTKIGILISSVSMLLLISLLITGFGYPGFFVDDGGNSVPFQPNDPGNLNYKGTNEEDLLNIKPVFSPKYSKGSGSKAFHIEPIPGITLSAEKDALDKDRQFKVERESEEQLDAYFSKTADFGQVPVASFKVDAGMAVQEKFPKEVEMRFDLKKLQIPEELWPLCTVMCICDDGSAMEMNAFAEDGVLSVQTNHNSAFLITVGVLATVGPGVIVTLDYYRMGIPKGEYCKDSIKVGSGKTARTYQLYYLKKDMRSDSPEYFSLQSKEKVLWNKYYNQFFGDDCGDRYGAYALKNYTSEDSKKRKVALALAKDGEYQEILKKYNDPAFKEEHLWPSYVKRTATMLRHADDFLYDEYMFSHQLHAVEVYIIDGPKGNEAYAHTTNLVTTRPFIKVYKNVRGFENDTGLAITMAHELFHVAQSSRYCQSDDRADTVFWEATAVVVERDAYRYYLDKNIIEKDDSELTERIFFGDFSHALMWYNYWEGDCSSKEWEELSKNQGYTASLFIEFMRDRYKQGSERSFMRNLMREYSYFSNFNWVDAMVDCTSGSEDALAHDYLMFCLKNTQNLCEKAAKSTMFQRVEVPLKQAGTMEHTVISREPLSTLAKHYLSSAKIKKFKTVILLNDKKDADDFEDTVLRIIDKDTFKPIRFIRGKGRCVLENIREFYVQTVNATTKKAEEAVYQVVLMAPPDPARPGIDPHEKGEADDEITVSYDKHPILEMSAVFRYKDHSVQVDSIKGEERIHVHKKELLSELGADSIKDVTVSLMYRLDPEEKEDPVFGPENEPVPASKVKANIKDFAGTYVGRFVNLEGKSFPATLNVEIFEVVSDDSAKCYYTYDFGDMKWDGTDSHGNKAYKLLILREDRAFIHTMDTIQFTLDAKTVHFERVNLKGEKIYMDGTKK